MEKNISNWAEDPYWTDALAAWRRRRDRGLRFLVLDLEAVERVAFNGDGPAFRLMNAMSTVVRDEGYDSYKGAPRVLLAALLRLAELSETTGRIPCTEKVRGRGVTRKRRE